MNAEVFIDTRFRLSYWDALIIAAAGELGCHTLYSEDFQNDQDYGGVKALNPFRDVLT
jgi:predicted nucleic acid-binding protein